MKKILFFAAVMALAFTACTNDELVEQKAQQATTEDIGVGFDVYLPGATQSTRAGRTNIMTTGTLQRTGFGIYAYQTENTTTDFSDPGYTAGLTPNYMWNQQVNFNSDAAGWYYAPLKYWPNETNKDSQITPTQAAGMPNQENHDYLDRLTFFAYAPWVSAASSTGVPSVINTHNEAADEGIVLITNNDGYNTTYSASKKDPIIKYVRAINPNNSVDLLWGVAPAGGLSYTNVSGGTTTVAEGFPLIDMVKPAVNTNMKFLFQHALARLGVKVVAAVDQVAAGGVFDYGNSKITIEKIEIAGYFGNDGYLNLNNVSANKANWLISHNATGADAQNPVLTIEAGKGLAPHLIYDSSLNGASKSQQTVTGVTTTLADAIMVSSTYDPSYTTDYATLVNTPAYSPTTPYFAAPADVVLSGSPAVQSYADYAYDAASGYFSNNTTDSIYFHKFTIDATHSNEAYTEITPSFQYPTATVWENIYAVAKSDVRTISDQTAADNYSGNYWVAYRVVGNTWIPTGKMPEIGDKVVKIQGTRGFIKSTLKKTASNYYLAKPNYFMVIPTNNAAIPTGKTEEDMRTLKVKITYYVSTTDDSLKDGIVYTKNEVEKDVVLPHLKNGSAYDLKLILGLTSVKVEAEVADWTTTSAEVNLPQNTSE